MILVTGAAGHLGNVLVRELLARGKTVRALVLPEENCQSLSELDVELFKGDILEPDTLNAAMQGVDTVFHLAGLVAISPGQEQSLWRVNVKGTENVIEAARRAGVRRLVYTSSIHALTRPPEGVTIDESLPFDPKNPAGMYDCTKAEASLRVLHAVKEEGLNAVIVCPTGVIGPYDYRRSEMGEMILTWMKSNPSMIVDGAFDFVDVRDVAQGHLLAAELGRTGETYILGGEHISVKRLCQLVKDYAGNHAPTIKIPLPLAMFFSRFAEIYYRLSRKRPTFTRYSLETLLSNSKISSGKAKKELGYQPRNLAVSLADTVRWWMEHRNLVRPTLRL